MKNKTITLAIADDHTLFRKGLINILNSYKSFTVIIEAGNGKDLIEKLSTCTTLPDICILDIDMRPINGYDAAKEIAQQWPAIKMIALSMYTDEYCIINMLRNGTRGFITKDTEPGELFSALEQLHKKGFYHDGIDPELLSRAMQSGLGVVPELTNSEKEFLSLCCSDLHYRDIAPRMNVSERTIDSFRDNLFKKLNVKSRPGLVTFAMLTGLGSNKTIS